MKCNFPITEINFKFNTFGTGEITVQINKQCIKDFPISGDSLRTKNTIDISFSKRDPSDQESYATLDRFTINGKDFTSDLKVVEYDVDPSKHPEADPTIKSNLYFGYIGKISFELEQDDTLLTKAAWELADKEFEYVKWPMKGDTFRTKDFDTMHRDARFMFVGVHNLKINPITDLYENKTLKELREPIDISTSRIKLEKWLDASSRFKLHNLNTFSHFTLSTGVQESLQSFIFRADNLFVTKKNFEGNGEMLEGKTVKVFDLLTEKIIPQSSVIIEIPAPWYDTKKLMSFIKTAKRQKCKIAIDATWLPVTNEPIDLDLTNVDEFYFSMNKAWPVDNFRPAFRWSREYVHDAQTFATLNCTYPKAGFQIFFQLIDQVEVDWTYNYFKDHANELCKTFNLEKTNILWFTKRQDKINIKKHIREHYHLEEFVSLVKLLQHKKKYFW